MSWEKAKEISEKYTNSSGLFVKLAKHGDKVSGVFRGTPYAREVIWTGKGYEAVDSSNPAHKGSEKKPTARVSLNFYVPAEKAMKVIEGGIQWFKDIVKVKEKYGQDTWTFEIERHGDANDTRTTYSVLPDTQIGAELRAEVDAAKLHDLKAIYAVQALPQKPAPATLKSVPFITPEAAGALVARLKGLPRPVVEQFLSQFGVSRVRDLRANQEAAALAFIGDHEPQSQSEINPFE